MPIIRASRLITLERHIAENDALRQYSSEVAALFHDLSLGFRIIARDIRRAGISDILGLTEAQNATGDTVKRLDVHANTTIYRSMMHGGHLCAMISEENEDVIQIPKEYKKGKYILAFDPLDGSTNIDVGANIGTIFSLYQRRSVDYDSEPNEEDILQQGDYQIIAGYINYGSNTSLVYTAGNGVDIFIFDPTIGEFILTYENVKIPQKGSYYSANEGNYFKWNNNVRKYIDYIKTPSEDKSRPYVQRYIATAVADIHRLLNYGGIYLYPEEINNPAGKIRLLYEASPLAMIIEQAGGRAISSNGRILDIQPNSIHQKIPFYVGSPDNINEFETFLHNGSDIVG